ncbi:rna polymerase sigma factor : RNA polymerase, sigma-24 subunit, ECF subfamily OS=Solibacter usitatus (strain Ellin6076) GN=Acid_3603 PE=4 SV=1: Sigma70_r2: Sigma70_r4_2: SnoaL_2 [Gemmataceae bacterium]|nr:rna polymerase sigma factor : RNA polymerase, sigma-24 subunit, ECF subfamily OS=Solibacter usitatus (strain Ellin6076) GN=Acid_3603 PE=4 SV=1: Sigma70_r2: Sigma70_r4_2: SnoaL_2 [Gemmataceae bacterium]VTT98843.1 rna polymerase sigma factor : RNA polymerase, sigma-24 subunit, ECF subfamily OS=Solibacter usitatus (strain Ellin6076) GN=Acid_3603 PE=4 SV=1: Sigma70_r2: Sigma70_r4_2: SnoaL_2 [Gemmataceae bacterium]
MTDEVSSLRPRMMSVAYRMLGSVADAEDAVQDAFVRYHTAGGVSSPEGFLVRTTTRICIDRLRERRRKEYVGPWVPEPVATRAEKRSDVLAESLTQAFLLLLERLTPDERAAFLLRTVFDYEYAEIAEVVGKSEEAVRQLVSRARGRLGLDGDRRFPAAPARADELAERFMAACRTGDVKAVEALLASDAEVHSDGGGKVSAARVVIRGRDKAARFLTGVFRKRWFQEVSVATVNGEPGLVFRSGDAVAAVLSLQVEGDVRAVYIAVNPDKLGRWAAAEVE